MSEEPSVPTTDSPETGEKLFRKVERTVLSSGLNIVKVPDTDEGKFVHMLYRSSRGNETLQTKGGDEIITEIMGGEWELVESELSGVQKERLNICVNELFLPTPLALYLALDSDEDLDNYSRPEKGTKQPISVAITGEPANAKSGKGVGKSLLTAVIARKKNWPVISLESLYAESADPYVNALEKANWPSDENGSYAQAIQIVDKSVWNGDGTKQRIGALRGLCSLFEEKLQPFRDSSERSEVYLFDMPGEPRKVRDEAGIVTGNTRPYKNTELLSVTGCETGVFTGRQLVPRQMERKVEWILDRVDNALKETGEAKIIREALSDGAAQL